ncbi:unnamed protein product [Ixodes pacificus]
MHFCKAFLMLWMVLPYPRVSSSDVVNRSVFHTAWNFSFLYRHPMPDLCESATYLCGIWESFLVPFGKPHAQCRWTMHRIATLDKCFYNFQYVFTPCVYMCIPE